MSLNRRSIAIWFSGFFGLYFLINLFYGYLNFEFTVPGFYYTVTTPIFYLRAVVGFIVMMILFWYGTKPVKAIKKKKV